VPEAAEARPAAPRAGSASAADPRPAEEGALPPVCVVLVNWNGWRDTVQCLESLLRSTGVELQVVVCDNDSGDGSLAQIRAWAEGRLAAPVDPSHPLSSLVSPPLAKPVRYAEYDRAGAERGGGQDADAPLVLVQTGANLGFAGGCNVGMRFALAGDRHRYVWLLNNDTVVHSDTLLHLVREAERDPRLGMVGSTLVSYDDPSAVQARGYGAYNPWLALPRHVRDADRSGDAAYVVGASMLVRRELMAQVGLMSEDYFLFFEELDWAMRAGRAWRLGHAPESVVFHKEGASNGGSSSGVGKSRLSDYYFMRNRIVFTRKFFPRRLPTVYLALGVAMARRAARGEWERARMIFDLCRST
jgi:GT2 family glycosyltransferase